MYGSSTPARAQRLAPFSSARLTPRPDGPLTHFASPRGETCRLVRHGADMTGTAIPRRGFTSPFREKAFVSHQRRDLSFSISDAGKMPALPGWMFQARAVKSASRDRNRSRLRWSLFRVFRSAAEGAADMAVDHIEDFRVEVVGARTIRRGSKGELRGGSHGVPAV